MMEQKVSLITVSFNSENTIEDTLQSVLAQSYRPLEYIVVDGASKDQTMRLVNQYIPAMNSKGIETKVLSEPDKGIADAWNKGLKLATGAVISYLNSDDWFDKDTVKKAMESFQGDTNQISYGVCERVSQEREYITTMRGRFSRSRLYLNFGFAFTTCFIHRSVFDKVGTFNPAFKIALDTDFLLRAVRNKTRFVSSEHITYMRLGGVSTSNVREADLEYERALIANGFNPLISRLFTRIKSIYRRIKGNT